MIKNDFLILLAIGLFLGAGLEYNYGYKYFGYLLFVLTFVIISKIEIYNTVKFRKSSYLLFFSGVLIVLVDLSYNYVYQKSIGTLDTMILLLGTSLIAINIKNRRLQELSIFSIYMSLTFIVLFIIIFDIFQFYNIKFLDYFDNYFLIIPAIFIVNAVGLDINLIGIELFQVNGVEDMIISIGNECSGFYSMFLLIGIVVSNAIINEMSILKTIELSIITIASAYIANLLRIIALIFIAYFYGREAMMFFHAHLGWIFFTLIAIFLMSLISKNQKK